MTAWRLVRDGAELAVYETGTGLPVLFQHGLGGDAGQVRDSFPDAPGLRRLTLECRGHGASGFGDVRPFSFALLADDLLAALDAAGIGRFVAGGISMGAGLALRLAVAMPARVAGLVLVRPAWGFSPAPGSMAPFALAARLLAEHPPEAATALFLASPEAQRLREAAPDNLASLAGLFERREARAFAAVMADIAADGPGVSRRDLAGLAVPTLVLGCGADLVHPLALARDLAGAIPGARFAELPAKSADRGAHADALRAAIARFLAAAIPDRSPPP